MGVTTEVSGKHSAIFDAYLKQIDPKNVGTIEAMVAAKFLKKSGLSDVVLSRIWDLSDPNGRGYLDKEGFFIALKLVSLAQAGHDINMRNIHMEMPNPPRVGDIPKIQPAKIQTVPSNAADWSIKPDDRKKYEQLFESLQPVDGLLPGNKVKGVLMDSKLPFDVLSKIWDLADQDKDGSLDKHEFLVAMHLVYQALDKKAIPTTLPIELQRPSTMPSHNGSAAAAADGGFVANFPTDIAPPPVPPLPAVITQHQPPSRPPPIPVMSNVHSLINADLMECQPLSTKSTTSSQSVDWVVSSIDQARFGVMFTKSDSDMDGLVSGGEIKDVFLQSGIPNMCLAQIWALCDTNQSGKLTSEQFALAMWMVERKQKGINPPDVLQPNMIPPSMRPKLAVQSSSGINDLNDMLSLNNDESAASQPVYTNPELKMISDEIEELTRERRTLEYDVAQREADIRIKTGEIRCLQNELDTLAATLKQLENQKGEAQKRLDDLKAQVNKIRDQSQKQEDTIRDQETELNSKRGELQKLKDEELSLTRQYDTNQHELDGLTKSLQNKQFEISQIKAMISQLQESQRQLNDALTVLKAAIEADNPSLVSDYTLKLEPDFREARSTLEHRQETKLDPFNDHQNEFSTSQFKSSSEFHSDPFADDTKNGFGGNFTTGAAASGFDDSFGTNQKSDPFASATKTFDSDPFGDKRSAQAITPDPNKDDFGSDPFAMLHAPTSASQILSPSPTMLQQPKSGPPKRPESPSPALPPKKSKLPPPRPAPPRPLQGPTPTRPEPSHDFDSAVSGGATGGFADFADFDAKSNQSKDFCEDPFKDYRYEDVFNIKDPFLDDSSEESLPIKTIDNQNAKTPKLFTAFDEDFFATSTTNNNTNNINNNFDRNAVQSSPSNYDKKQSSQRIASIDAFGSNTLTTTSSSQTKIDSDNLFIANFEDEFENNTNTTTSTLNNNGNNNNNKIIENFGKFDAFDVEEKFDAFGLSTNMNMKKSSNLKRNEALDVQHTINKFADDFSKTDTFDNDLQEILKRSLTDK